MGYRGRLDEQDKARLLREEGRTLADIATTLGVSKSSVSLWVRDIPVEIRRQVAVERRPHAQHLAKLAEIEECDEWAERLLGTLSEQAFLAAGAALYAGEGAKGDGCVKFANTDPAMVAFFCAWFRRFFDIDESRMRVSVYLHEGLDLDAAEEYWSDLTGVRRTQFRKSYRAKADPSMRTTKHEYGCVYVHYACSRTHRMVMGLIRALISSGALPG